ncbi:MAG: HEAT repeat domain-containing protein [Bacillota bacterium]|uniref:HEAT repeat domain-containing protein n=1 Tax=Thermanaerosceptrum fracticalcis TaxID=1712410 RepID=A0A7G6E4Z1_THEFR|nr:HEAT repeat domain-containing protein [Thermanaerosceptrum fracticalcis]QNB47145.1 hypothetical protein BR63_13020 [Thermanaerosceptrum fracticalcis]
MAWFGFGSTKISLEELKKSIIESPDTFPQDLRKNLEKIEFVTGWELIKLTLPSLNKVKGRNLVRLLLGDKIHLLESLVEERTERLLAIECLGYLPSRETVEILVRLLSSKDESVQLAAAGALKHHTPRLVVPYLVDALLEGAALPSRVGEVLLVMGYYAEEALLEAFPRATPPVQAHILELLTHAVNPKCKDLVAEALKHDDFKLKNKALEAIASFSFTEFWPEVVMCLAEPQWTLRAKALEVLAKLEIKEARDFVEAFLHDEDEWVRECAQNYLKTIESVSTVTEEKSNVVNQLG